MDQVEMTSPPRALILSALAGSAWALFLLPPQVTAWDGAAAPAWARGLDGAQPYEWVRSAGAALGLTDDYVLFGLLIAPAFVLVGVPLLGVARAMGRPTALLAWLTLLGAPVCLLSYGGHGLGGSWDAFWGAEIPLLLLICVWGAVAGALAFRRRRVPVWCAVALAATPVVLVVSTAVFTYFPHGTVVGYGVEVAALAACALQGTGRRAARSQGATV